MGRTVKHFSLHRIAGTELRVVADVEAGVLPFVQVEEAVIRGYAQQGLWPHRSVTLFILQDLQPLIRQLRDTETRRHGDTETRRGTQRVPEISLSLSPLLPLSLSQTEGDRPMLNVYDLANPDSCHVFVNQQAMVKEGYWDDSLAIRGLLAHEHAHPLAENETTRGSRRLALEISLGDQPATSETGGTLARLADKLCCYAPREIFANQMTLTSGFGEALLHLNRLNLANASRGLAGRAELGRRLQTAVARGRLMPAEADLLLLIGDLSGHLDLALEVAPFYRSGRKSDAQALEATLEQEVFPHLDPQVAPVYTALRDQYVALHDSLTASELVTWGAAILDRLAEALAQKGLVLRHRLSRA